MSDILNPYSPVTQQFPILMQPLKGTILHGQNYSMVQKSVCMPIGRPPFINKGGITLTSSFTTLSSLTPPYPKITAIVDYLSFSFPLGGLEACNKIGVDDWRNYTTVLGWLDAIIDNPEVKINSCDSFVSKEQWDSEYGDSWRENWLDPDYSTASSSVETFLRELRTSTMPDLSWISSEKGFSGYKHAFHLFRDGQFAGWACYGGDSQKNTVLISITGAGCSGLDMHKMRVFMEHIPFCKMTRVDLAHDDLLGNVTIETVKRWYFLGLFHSRGAAPSHKEIRGDDGWTFYIGKKTSGKELCVYKKGMEQGDKNSPWVRFEGRFYAVDCVLPFEMLTSPAVFLSGMYKPLNHLCAFHERVKIITEYSRIKVQVAIDNARRSYGQYLTAFSELVGYTKEEVFDLIARPGIPKRLEIPLAPCPF